MNKKMKTDTSNEVNTENTTTTTANTENTTAKHDDSSSEHSTEGRFFQRAEDWLKYNLIEVEYDKGTVEKKKIWFTMRGNPVPFGYKANNSDTFSYDDDEKNSWLNAFLFEQRNADNIIFTDDHMRVRVEVHLPMGHVHADMECLLQIASDIVGLLKDTLYNESSKINSVMVERRFSNDFVGYVNIYVQTQTSDY